MDSKDDAKFQADASASNEITVVHNDRAVWETRETYGPAGELRHPCIDNDEC